MIWCCACIIVLFWFAVQLCRHLHGHAAWIKPLDQKFSAFKSGLRKDVPVTLVSRRGGLCGHCSLSFLTYFGSSSVQEFCDHFFFAHINCVGILTFSLCSIGQLYMYFCMQVQ